jgi:hypothetical protein
VRRFARVARFFLVVAGLGVALLMAVAYVRRDHPMLYRLEDEGCACLVPATIAIPNPFRDRSPERPAIELLRLLEWDQCEVAVAKLANEVYPTEFCRRGVSDVSPHVTHWYLRDRVTERRGVRLTYTVWFSGQSRSSWLWFLTVPDGQRWKALYMGNEVWFE